jgi:hypothetical protein
VSESSVGAGAANAVEANARKARTQTVEVIPIEKLPRNQDDLMQEG